MATDAQILAVIQYCFDRMMTNTNNACVAFCNEVCHQLRGTGYELGAGLVAKEPGQEHGVGADGQRYAVDAIWIAAPSRSADILIAAPMASQPWLSWYVGDQIPPTATFRTPYGSRQLPLYETGTPPPGPGPDPEPPPGEVPEAWKAMLERLDVLIEQGFRDAAFLQDLVDGQLELLTLLRSVLRAQPDGTQRLGTQVENRVKIGW